MLSPSDLQKLFAGTSGPRRAKIAIVGESWGEREAFERKPFVGRSGMELTKILSECGIARSDVFLTNLVSAQPASNDMRNFCIRTERARKENLTPYKGLFVKEIITDGITRLKQQLEYVQPDLVIGFGNYALWALTDDCFKISDDGGYKVPRGIGEWRGSQLNCSPSMGGFKFLPTYHPAAALRQWPWRYDIVHDLKARTKRALANKWAPPNYNFVIRPSLEEAVAILEKLIGLASNVDKPLWLASDIEGGNKTNYLITCIGFAWSKTEAICIPFTKNGVHESYWTEEEELIILLLIRRLFLAPGTRIIGMNFLYDAQYIATYWQFIPRCDADVMILQHLCWPGQPRSLNYISSLYNNFHRYWKDEGKDWHPTFSDEQHWGYNCTDCVITFEANTHLQSLIDTLGLREQETFETPLYDLCLDLMLRGVLIDLEARDQFGIELDIVLAHHKQFLNEVIPIEVYDPPRKKNGKLKQSPWYTSPKQQGVIFYDLLGYKEITTKRGKKSATRAMNDAALDTLGKRDSILFPITTQIRELRSLRKFRNDFVGMQLDEDDRARCFFDPTATRTFRWSASKSVFESGANLQTIPKGTED